LVGQASSKVSYQRLLEILFISDGLLFIYLLRFRFFGFDSNTPVYSRFRLKLDRHCFIEVTGVVPFLAPAVFFQKLPAKGRLSYGSDLV